MKYIILCGSNHEYVNGVPRQLVTINGERILDRTIRLLRENGITDISITATDPAFDDVDVDKIDVSFRSSAGVIPVCKNGAGIEFSEEIAKEILLKDEIEILIDLNDGKSTATAWGCDLTYDYVKINGDYRT